MMVPAMKECEQRVRLFESGTNIDPSHEAIQGPEAPGKTVESRAAGCLDLKDLTRSPSSRDSQRLRGSWLLEKVSLLANLRQQNVAAAGGKYEEYPRLREAVLAIAPRVSRRADEAVPARHARQSLNRQWKPKRRSARQVNATTEDGEDFQDTWKSSTARPIDKARSFAQAGCRSVKAAPGIAWPTIF